METTTTTTTTTPIGKSVFGILMVLLAIQQRKHIAFKAKGSKTIYFFTWNRVEYDVTHYPIGDVHYEGYLDGNDRGEFFWYSYHICPAYLFASPGESNYNEFKKDSCHIVYMNPWSKQECLKFAEFFGLEDDCRCRFNLVGGKVRLIFSPVESYEDLVAIIKDSIPEDINEMNNHLYHVRNDAYQDEMKYILYMQYRDDCLPHLSHMVFSPLIVDTMMRTRFPFVSRIEL